MSTAQQKAASATGEAAAEWVVRLHGTGLDAAGKAAFMQWLRESPVHVREYFHAEVLFLAMQDVAWDDPAGADDLRALLDDERRNVIGLPVRSTAASSPPLQRPARRRFIAAAAVAVVAIAAFAATVALWPHAPAGEIYTTGIDEQRRIVLADGSVVDLNSHSSLRVALTGTRRDIHLEQGEAFFVVAKDVRRLFTVTSDAAVVRAVGTQFNVRRRTHGTVVTVIEGRVAVSNRLLEHGTPGRVMVAAGRPVELSEGDEIVISPERKPTAADLRPASTSARAATAWRQHRLVFENAALAEVVVEFNRYNLRQFVIHDPVLAAERISGVFDADKPGDLLGFLANNGEVSGGSSASRITLTLPE